MAEFWDPALFEKSFDAVDQWMGILDKDGQIIKINRAGLEFIGANESEISSLPLWAITWPALKKQDRVVLKKALREAALGKVFRKELILADGQEMAKALDLSIKPVLAPDHTVQFLLVEGHDVSDYHRTSAALLQSEARFKTIFKEAGIGIVIKAENGKILDCNPAFQSMVGYTSSELRERDYLEITHPNDASMSRRLFTDLITGKRRNYFLEKRYLRKDGQVVWGRMVASLMRGPSDAGKYVIGMVENITANKQIEAELDELQHRLMQGKDNERLRLAQDLHDGPLQEIIGVVYQVQEFENSQQNAEDKDQLKAIRAALQQVIWSVRSICGELRPPTLVPFGLEKTILSHVERFKSVHPEYIITCKLAHDGLVLPENVRNALFRIYQEAMNNIVRHAHAQNIKISFRVTSKKAALEIQDDGVGFDLPDHWVKLARQGHLGLVGAVERAKDVGGTLEVLSGQNKGTRIRVSVQLKESGAQSPAVLEEIKA